MRSSLLAALAVLVFALPAAGQRVSAIRAGRLLDVKTGTVAQNAVVLVSNGRITAVGSNVAVPPDAEVIDLSRCTVLPGLIDTHTHLLTKFSGTIGGDDPNSVLTVAQLGTVRRALLGAKMGKEALESGITTVRDGADVIKVIVNTEPRFVSVEALKAIVEEGNRVGRKVAAHAIGNTATRIAAEAGVASIEHGYVIPDDVLGVMASKKIF